MYELSKSLKTPALNEHVPCEFSDEPSICEVSEPLRFLGSESDFESYAQRLTTASHISFDVWIYLEGVIDLGIDLSRNFIDEIFGIPL